jgi:hypothetical protein
VVGSYAPLKAEIRFNIITQCAIRRDAFNSVRDHISCRPFSWTATADSVIEKINGPCMHGCRWDRTPEIAGYQPIDEPAYRPR